MIIFKFSDLKKKKSGKRGKMNNLLMANLSFWIID